MMASTGSTDNALFTMFTVVQFFFGVGVGGECGGAGWGAGFGRRGVRDWSTAASMPRPAW